LSRLSCLQHPDADGSRIWKWRRCWFFLFPDKYRWQQVVNTVTVRVPRPWVASLTTSSCRSSRWYHHYIARDHVAPPVAGECARRLITHQRTASPILALSRITPIPILCVCRLSCADKDNIPFVVTFTVDWFKIKNNIIMDRGIRWLVRVHVWNRYERYEAYYYKHTIAAVLKLL